MQTFGSYFKSAVLTEELHSSIQSHLDSDGDPKYKLSHISSAIRTAIKAGIDTGLEGSTPKKGSSRAVFFPRDPHKIVLDGKEAHVPSVMKVAFPGHLDKHNDSGALLGEHQNRVENDHFLNTNYGIIAKNHDGSYSTNKEHGVLAPHLGGHDEDHYVHQGRIEKFNAADLRNQTKNSDFPKGLNLKEVHAALVNHYENAHGSSYETMGGMSQDRMNKVQSHPFVEKMQDFHAMAGVHPGDFSPRNLGVWVHPHTGERHVVISDYGFAHDVQRHYQNARRNMAKAAERDRFGRW